MKKLIGVIVVLLLVLAGCGATIDESQLAEDYPVEAVSEIVTFRSSLDFYFGFDMLLEWFDVDGNTVQYNEDDSMTVEISPEARAEFAQNLWELIDFNMEWLVTERLVGLERAEMSEDFLTMTWYIADNELFNENYLTGLFDFFMHEMGLFSSIPLCLESRFILMDLRWCFLI